MDKEEEAKIQKYAELMDTHDVYMVCIKAGGDILPPGTYLKRCMVCDTQLWTSESTLASNIRTICRDCVKLITVGKGAPVMAVTRESVRAVCEKHGCEMTDEEVHWKLALAGMICGTGVSDTKIL